MHIACWVRHWDECIHVDACARVCVCVYARARCSSKLAISLQIKPQICAPPCAMAMEMVMHMVMAHLEEDGEDDEDSKKSDSGPFHVQVVACLCGGRWTWARGHVRKWKFTSRTCVHASVIRVAFTLKWMLSLVDDMCRVVISQMTH